MNGHDRREASDHDADQQREDDGTARAGSPELEVQLIRSPRIKVLITPHKGRGVFARESIPADTLIEVSPVLIVPNAEYTHNTLSNTIFESYLFTWSRAGDYALALGPGSLFNHSDTAPNVSYVLDKPNQCIRYTTKRTIEKDEELCIFYGHGISFGKRGELLVDKHQSFAAVEKEEEEDVLKALGGYHSASEDEETSDDSEFEDDDTLVPISDLPLDFVTGIVAPEDIPLETIDAYVLTFVPQISSHFLRYLQSHNIHQLQSVRHLKRIRKLDDTHVQGIISPVSDYSLEELSSLLASSPHFEGLPIPPISIKEVPANPARTPAQAKEWSPIYWPVSYIPIKDDVMAKDRAESFSQAKINWMKGMCLKVIQATEEAESKGELPIVCLAAESWDPNFHSLKRKKGIRPVVISQKHDSRNSSKNPFGHAAMNLIEDVAELDRNGTRPNLPTNDANYLLTGLTVFMSHEPCLLCSMALLHSRINTLVYVKESPGAGGCGSEYRLHEQKGTNHRFEVYKVKPDSGWKGMLHQVPDIQVDP